MANPSGHARSTAKGLPMLGRKPKLTALEIRKQLLIAESELNRATMREDWASLQTIAQQLMEKGRSVFSVASTAAVAAAGFSALRGIWGRGNGGTTAWLPRLLKLARIGASLWFTSRSRRP